MTALYRNENPFSGAFLERRSAARSAPNWATEAQSDSGTRFLVSRGTQHLVLSEPTAGIAFLSADHPLIRQTDPTRWLLLGWFQGARCVLVSLLQNELAVPARTSFEELRPLLLSLPADQAAVLACARALLVWHARHRHCGVCGAPTAIRSAGHAIKCTSTECGAEFFPRIDPAIIVIVSDGGQVLLGRQAAWPPGRYSALAGFVEPGETLEDAVAREVFEETGVRIDHASYFASQPWPFPSSLMLGFHAHARHTAVTLNDELEDARWYRAAELERAPAEMLPPHHTIARRLIESWFQDVCGRPLNAGV